MAFEIRQLPRGEYQDHPFTVRYVTDRYYDVVVSDDGFRLELKNFPAPVERGFSEKLFSAWLEAPVVFGAFEGEKLIGFFEGSPESWHALFRISNVFIEEGYRGKGVGSKLMEYVLDWAMKQNMWRGVILETQTCNYPAICFYKKHGFRLTRIDITEYDNDDVANKAVRIDLIHKF